MGELNLLNINEFVEKGYLQEANRLFFHPLGLSLVVKYDEDSQQFALGGVLDCRSDEEGVVFGSSKDSGQASVRTEKFSSVQKEIKEKSSIRVQRFGWSIQPIEDMVRTDSMEVDGQGH